MRAYYYDEYYYYYHKHNYNCYHYYYDYYYRVIIIIIIIIMITVTTIAPWLEGFGEWGEGVRWGGKLRSCGPRALPGRNKRPSRTEPNR